MRYAGLASFVDVNIAIVLSILAYYCLFLPFSFLISSWSGLHHFALHVDKLQRLHRLFQSLNMFFLLFLLLSALGLAASLGKFSSPMAAVGSIGMTLLSVFTGVAFLVYAHLLETQVAKTQQKVSSSMMNSSNSVSTHSKHQDDDNITSNETAVRRAGATTTRTSMCFGFGCLCMCTVGRTPPDQRGRSFDGCMTCKERGGLGHRLKIAGTVACVGFLGQAVLWIITQRNLQQNNSAGTAQTAKLLLLCFVFELLAEYSLFYLYRGSIDSMLEAAKKKRPTLTKPSALSSPTIVASEDDQLTRGEQAGQRHTDSLSSSNIGTVNIELSDMNG